MDITRELMRSHSRHQANKVADYVEDNPIHFKQLIDIYLAGPYRITQRAAWPLSLAVERNPSLVTPHLGKLLRFLRKPGIHDAVKRNTMRLLQYIDIPSRHRGDVIDLCFQYLQDRKEAIAIRAFAMTVVFSIIRQEADLCKELTIILEDEMPYAKPAFASRAKRILKEVTNPIKQNQYDKS